MHDSLRLSLIPSCAYTLVNIVYSMCLEAALLVAVLEDMSILIQINVVVRITITIASHVTKMIEVSAKCC